MKLREILTSDVHKLMVVDGGDDIVFCGRDVDPGSFKALYPYLGRDVVSMGTSGTYSVARLGKE